MKITLEFDDEILDQLADRIAAKFPAATEIAAEEAEEAAATGDDDDLLGGDEKVVEAATLDTVHDSIRSKMAEFAKDDKTKEAGKTKIKAALAKFKDKAGKAVLNASGLLPADYAAAAAAIGKVKK